MNPNLRPVLPEPWRVAKNGFYRQMSLQDASMSASSTEKVPWIASIPVVVSDREVSKKWYTEKLGLDLIDDDDHWVTVGGRGKGTVIHLCQASENQPNPIPLEPGPSGIVIKLPGDFVVECKKLKENGIEFSHLPEEAPWGWYATIRDPDGNEHYLAPAA